MAHYWFILLLVIDRVTPISWFVVVTGLLAWKMQPRVLFVSSIVLGIIHDIIWVEDFGWMSLGLVILGGLTLLARNKLGDSAFWLWLALLTSFQFGYSFLQHQQLAWVLAIVHILVASVLWRLVVRAKHSSEVYLQ